MNAYTFQGLITVLLKHFILYYCDDEVLKHDWDMNRIDDYQTTATPFGKKKITQSILRSFLLNEIIDLTIFYQIYVWSKYI